MSDWLLFAFWMFGALIWAGWAALAIVKRVPAPRWLWVLACVLISLDLVVAALEAVAA